MASKNMAVTVPQSVGVGTEKTKAGGGTVARLLPAGFIVLWSSGYIGGVFGVRYAEPFTLIFWRFSLAAVIFFAVAMALDSKWPRRVMPYLHAGMVGILLQAVQFGGVYSGFALGVPSGQSSLIIGMMPILVVLGASIWLGEKLSWRDLPGSLLGIGGVVIVVAHSLSSHAAPLQGYLCTGVALLGITAGTIYQKKFMGGMDLWVGCFVQMLVAAAIMFVLARSTETMQITRIVPFAWSVGWITVVNSFGAISLLYTMIRRGEASKAGNLFHVIPAVTQIMAAIVFREIPGTAMVLGLLISSCGVYLMNRGHARKPRRSVERA